MYRITHELVFLATNVGDIHVVGGWAKIFKLLASEDVNGNKMDLCVAVLASLRGGHLNDLAGTVLNHNETVLAKRRALHRVGGGGTGIGALKGVLMLLAVLSACCYRVFSNLTRRRERRRQLDKGGVVAER